MKVYVLIDGRDAEQALAELKSNIEYDKLNVTLEEFGESALRPKRVYVAIESEPEHGEYPHMVLGVYTSEALAQEVVKGRKQHEAENLGNDTFRSWASGNDLYWSVEEFALDAVESVDE